MWFSHLRLYPETGGIPRNAKWQAALGSLAEKHLTIHGWPHDDSELKADWSLKPPARIQNEVYRLELLMNADLELKPMAVGERLHKLVFFILLNLNRGY